MFLAVTCLHLPSRQKKYIQLMERISNRGGWVVRAVALKYSKTCSDHDSNPAHEYNIDCLKFAIISYYSNSRAPGGLWLLMISNRLSAILSPEKFSSWKIKLPKISPKSPQKEPFNLPLSPVKCNCMPSDVTRALFC